MTLADILPIILRLHAIWPDALHGDETLRDEQAALHNALAAALPPGWAINDAGNGWYLPVPKEVLGHLAIRWH